jgi:hypothetical protein
MRFLVLLLGSVFAACVSAAVPSGDSRCAPGTEEILHHETE